MNALVIHSQVSTCKSQVSLYITSVTIHYTLYFVFLIGAVKFENWRGKGIISLGIAHQIETALPNIKAKYLSAINMHYKRSVPAENQWRFISQDCLKSSCTFILDLITYIDEMMRTLTQGDDND